VNESDDEMVDSPPVEEKPLSAAEQREKKEKESKSNDTSDHSLFLPLLQYVTIDTNSRGVSSTGTPYQERRRSR